MNIGEYKIEAKDGLARVGTLMTAHGEVKTPCFMPVGTKASVKSLDPQVVKDLGAQVVLANTYHLFLSPGADLISQMGGLHNFMQWDGPILTDSGGFQVFSLGEGKKNRNKNDVILASDARPESLAEDSGQAMHHDSAWQAGMTDNYKIYIPEAKITEEGVKFKSYKDGSMHFIGPEESIEIQSKLGADIIMAFDECPPYPATDEYYKLSTERTHRWLERCIVKKNELENRHSGERRDARIDKGSWTSQDDNNTVHYYQNTPKDQLLFGIVQGGMSKEGREQSAKYVSSKDLPGVAIGGVANGGESRELMINQVEWALAEIPESKPRYLMGIGTPLDLVEFVKRGVDMFDCVLPTRLGRNGAAWVIEAEPPLTPPSKGGGRVTDPPPFKGGARGGSGKGKRIQIKNAQYYNNPQPLMEGCGCSTCNRFSRAYLHHLFKEDEPLGMELLSIHNIHILLEIMRQMREAIFDHRFEALTSELIDIWG